MRRFVQLKNNSRTPTILIVDDEQDMRWLLSNIIKSEGFNVQQAVDGRDAILKIKQSPPDLVLLDIKMPNMGGMEVLEKIKEIDFSLPVIMLTAHGDIPTSVQAIKMGAYDFLTKPFDNDQIMYTINRAFDHFLLQREVKSLREQLKDRSSLFSLMGTSHQIQKISYQVDQVAQTNFTVILQGETGTGKELVAHFIHRKSTRKNMPFVPVDCGAIPDTLIESELFGYKKGAFTGATQDKAGYFELAREGTLLLDEVANIPLNTQKKLLRILQERQFYRLGGTKAIEADVRIVAASNLLLEDEVRLGNLRHDLYHRLNEFTIYLPPLRERKEDILFLAKKFADETSTELGKNVHGFSQQAVNWLLSQEWPGNVRELRNNIRRAVLLSPDIIQPHHLSQKSLAKIPSTDETSMISWSEESSLRDVGQNALEQAEIQAIKQALEEAQGNKVKAARQLKTDYKTLYRKLKKYKL
jgi:DNA-binding NtrC family response regulator